MIDKNRHIEDAFGEGACGQGARCEGAAYSSEVVCAEDTTPCGNGVACESAAAMQGEVEVACDAAAQYRRTADEHTQTLKEFWKNFLVSGLFVLATLAVIIACLAWFLNNNQVAARTVGVTAAGSRYTLMAEGEGDQGSRVGYYERSERTDAEKAELGSLDTQDSMTVTLTFNLNNYEKDSLYPGASGKISFKVVPLTTQLGDIQINLSRALETNIKKLDENGNEIEGAAKENQELFSLFNNHLLFFGNCDDNGFYSNRITGESITIDRSRFCVDGSTDTTKTVTVDLYWVWPEYLQNFVLVGNALYYKNLFASVGEGSTSDYNKLQNYINANKASFYYGTSTTGTGEDKKEISPVAAPSLSANMTSANIETCAELYNNADEYLGSHVTYFQIRISAQETTSAQGATS